MAYLIDTPEMEDIMGTVSDSTLYNVLRHFSYERFTPSRGLLQHLHKAGITDLSQRQLTELLISMSNEFLVIFNEQGDILSDGRMLEKLPESGRQSAVYRLTEHGRDMLAELDTLLDG